MTAYRKINRTGTTVATPSPTEPARTHDVVGGRPLFKAPNLPNSRAIHDPLPFTDTRVPPSQSDRVKP